jgi:Type VI secretion system/phage-baseplate injector OB domain
MSEADLDRLMDALEGRFYGKYRGKVVDNVDPLMRGSLQVIVPSVLGEQAIWALPCSPYAGPRVGFFALPPVDANVWVEFEGGQCNYPIWAGCFWQDGEIESADAVPEVMFLRTPGATLRIEASGTLTIETEGGAKITMTATEIKIEAAAINSRANGGSTALSASGFDAMNGALTVI